MADQSTIGPTLLVLCPLLVGVISIVTRSHRVTDFLAQAVGLVSLLLLIPLSGVVLAEGPVTLNLGGHRAPVAIPLYVDGLSLLALWLTTWIAVAVHAYAAEWLRVTAHPASMEYRMLWPLLWSGLNGLFLSADLFNVYVMLEVTTLGAVSLVIMGREGEAAEAATRYLHFGLIGSVLYLLGVALVYMHVGSLYMPLLPGKVSLTPAMAVALFCMTAGLAMKAALFPVHAWLPLAHASAPAPASALLSGLVAAAGVYLVLRIWLGSFTDTWNPTVAQAMGLTGAAGMIYGSVQALRQSRIKLIVAYSTMAQLGYLLLLLPLSGAISAWNAAMYHLATHGLAKAGIFLAASNIVLACGTDQLKDLRVGDRFTASNLLVIGLAGATLAGLPPTGGFVAKWWMLSAALEQKQWWWVPVVIASGLLAAAYIFRILHHGIRSNDGIESARKSYEVAGASQRLLWPAMLLSLTALGLGVMGNVLAPFLGAGIIVAGTVIK